jgi:hypothetical protein
VNSDVRIEVEKVESAESQESVDGSGVLDGITGLLGGDD